jgi:hypothetical protein
VLYEQAKQIEQAGMLRNNEFNNKYLTQEHGQQRSSMLQKEREIVKTRAKAKVWPAEQFVQELTYANRPPTFEGDTYSSSTDDLDWLEDGGTSLGVKSQARLPVASGYNEAVVDPRQSVAAGYTEAVGDSDDIVMDDYQQNLLNMCQGKNKWDRDERKKLDVEWRELKEKKDELYSMMCQFQTAINNTPKPGTWSVGGNGVAIGSMPTVSPLQSGIYYHSSINQAQNYQHHNYQGGNSGIGNSYNSPSMQGWTHHEPFPAVKQETQNMIPPPVKAAIIVKDKNEQRRQLALAKREALVQQEERKKEQEELRNRASQQLHHIVKKKETKRSITKKQEQKKKESGASKKIAKKITSREGKKIKQTQKSETSVNEESHTVKVIKHLRDQTDKIKVEVRIGEKTMWMKLEEFWTDENIPIYGPAWNLYMTQQHTMYGTQSSAGKESKTISSNKGGEVRTQTSATEEEDSDATEQEDSDSDPADCYNHVLDNRGGVYMELHWKEDGMKSRGDVRKIMGSMSEKRQLGGPWLEYCDRKGIMDESFRMKGKAIVKAVKGHDWADCGRPRVEIEWVHGDITQVLVRDCMDLKGDANSFIAKWAEYCDSIGDEADEGFRKGHVNKEHKMVVKKKRRVKDEKWV